MKPRSVGPQVKAAPPGPLQKEVDRQSSRAVNPTMTVSTHNFAFI
jgi:hypothetical protein